jgi:hypothetical protein
VPCRNRLPQTLPVVAEGVEISIGKAGVGGRRSRMMLGHERFRSPTAFECCQPCHPGHRSGATTDNRLLPFAFWAFGREVQPGVFAEQLPGLAVARLGRLTK